MNILKSRSRGVTLTELSIVLAILGILIVAGVSGKFLIDASRATTTIQQLADRTLAFRVFFTSYDCIPGDCLDADIKTQSLSTMNGNGDGNINVYGTSVNKNEVAFVEEHLSKSRLFIRTLNYTGIDYTKINLSKFLTPGKIAGSYISSVSSGGSVYNVVGGFSTNNNGTVPDVVNFTPANVGILRIIDSKTDDSIANSGNIKCYTTQYTQTADIITLPTPASDYNADCVLTSIIEFK